MPLKPYKTLIKEAQEAFIVNKSRFIGHGCPCETEEAALAFLARMRSEYKDATHNCYAYIIGANMGVMRYSDDGEPGGTAGMPIIEVMKARGVTNCAVVVTRYFGGILLGGGGLVRAYSHTAKIAVDAGGIAVMRLCAVMQAECDYNFYGKLNSFIPECGGIVDNAEFAENVKLDFRIPADFQQEFESKLTDISFGKVSAEKKGEIFCKI